jgi:hypothetical protein
MLPKNYFHFLFSENYRLQSKYDNHLIAKVALFQFVNSFLSLFYIAFYLRDEEKLKEVSKVHFDSNNIKPNNFQIPAIGGSLDFPPNYRQPKRISATVCIGAMEIGSDEFQSVWSIESNKRTTTSTSSRR